jgi:hypothetical protein
MAKNAWPRHDKIAFVSLLVAVIGCIIAIAMPEIRKYIGLEGSTSRNFDYSNVNQSFPLTVPKEPDTTFSNKNNASRSQPQNPSSPISSQPTNPSLPGGIMSVDLNGEWELVDTIESSSYTAYINAQAGFRLFIKQEGTQITAEGEKVWITGRSLEPNEHTPIHVTGIVKGNSVEATFVEEGLRRKSSGRFVWEIEGNRKLIGTFVSTAADTSGTSVATKK